MKNKIMVKHAKSMDGLKRLLNRLDSDEKVSEVEWQPGTMGFYVAYRVTEPGYNIGNRREESQEVRPEAQPQAQGKEPKEEVSEASKPPLMINLVKTGETRWVADRVGLPGSPIVGNARSPLAAIGALFWHGAHEFRVGYTPRAIDWMRKKHPDHCYEESK